MKRSSSRRRPSSTICRRVHLGQAGARNAIGADLSAKIWLGSHRYRIELRARDRFECRGDSPYGVVDGIERYQKPFALACPARLSGGLRVAVFQLERFKYRLSHSRSNSRGSHRRAPSLEKIIELVKVGSRRQLHAVLIAISLFTCVSQRSRRM